MSGFRRVHWDDGALLADMPAFAGLILTPDIVLTFFFFLFLSLSPLLSLSHYRRPCFSYSPPPMGLCRPPLDVLAVSRIFPLPASRPPAAPFPPLPPAL